MSRRNSTLNFEDEVANCKSLDDVTGKDGLIQRMCLLQVLFGESCKRFFHSIASPFSIVLQVRNPIA